TQSHAHGALAWLHINLREWDAALGEARKYIDGAPNEPQAHKTLADALLNTNQVKEAAAELEKAVALGARSRQAFYDLAAIKGLVGEFAGAHDAMEKSKQFEAQDSDGLERVHDTAWLLLTEGKQGDAFKLLDTMEKDVDARKLMWPDLPAQTRARMNLVLGR